MPLPFVMFIALLFGYIVLCGALLFINPSKYGRYPWITVPSFQREDLKNRATLRILRLQGALTVTMATMVAIESFAPGLFTRLGVSPWVVFVGVISSILAAVGGVMLFGSAALRWILPTPLLSFRQRSFVGNVIVRLWGTAMLCGGVFGFSVLHRL